MRPDRPVGLLMVFALLGSATARGADPAAVLKEKGLTKSGTVYLIEDEKPVLEKLKEVKALFASYGQAAERQAAQAQIAYNLAEMGQQHAAMQQELNALNQQSRSRVGGRMGRMANSPQFNPVAAERVQMQAAMNELSANQKTLKSQVLSAKDKTALDAEIKKRAESFKGALVELRPMVDQVTKAYADLDADEAVKKARDELAKETHANIKLGPSEAFKAAEKYLARAEREVLGKRPSAAVSKKAKAKK